MPTFDELYARLVKAALHDATQQELEQLRKEDLDEHQLDCLLHPQNYAPVWRVGNFSGRNVSQPIDGHGDGAVQKASA